MFVVLLLFSSLALLSCGISLILYVVSLNGEVALQAYGAVTGLLL
jgi:hypothetical protein